VPGWNCYEPYNVGVVLLSRCSGRLTKNKVLKEFCWLAGYIPTKQLPQWMSNIWISLQK
jgi:hypothetical protein